MNNAAIISGYSVHLPFAKDSDQLISRLKLGERVKTVPWFKSDAEAIKCGFKRNLNVAAFAQREERNVEFLCGLIDDALDQAGLDKGCLAGENVRVYLTGIGPRVDAQDYKLLYNHNDLEDLLLTISLAKLQVANMSQDNVAQNIAHRYGLRYMPPNLNCTSNSALTAVHLGCKGIEKGDIDLVLVNNCSVIRTQDIWFLVRQSMLESESVQPFGEDAKAVLFAEGFSALLLESDGHRRARQKTGGVRLKSVYTQISAGRGNDSSMLSSCMLKVMSQALKESQLTPADLCAIIPHGNGSAITDNAEAKAIAILTGEQPLPVLAYKGQVGYTATGSGTVDLIIGHYSLLHRELLTPVSNGPITEAMAAHLLTDRGIVSHEKQHLLKVGVGMDGSIIGIVMSDLGVDG